MSKEHRNGGGPRGTVGGAGVAQMNNESHPLMGRVPPPAWAPGQVLDLWKFSLQPPCATDGDTEPSHCFSSCTNAPPTEEVRARASLETQ